MSTELTVLNVVVAIVLFLMVFSFVVILFGYDPLVCLCSTTYCRRCPCDLWGRFPEERNKKYTRTERQKELDRRARVRVVPAVTPVVAPVVAPQAPQPTPVENTPVVQGEVVDDSQQQLPLLPGGSRRYVSV